MTNDIKVVLSIVKGNLKLKSESKKHSLKNLHQFL